MALDDLVHRSRPPAGEAEGALVLLHGRGVDEHDLFPLLDLIDPSKRLAGFTPRAPLTPPGHIGNHWYVVERVGFPDTASFATAYERLSGWLDSVVAETGIEADRLVIGGFSQGGVMSYATGLGSGRPVPGAIFALSSFVPTVEGWEPDFTGRSELPVYHSHGTADPIIGVEFGRQTEKLLEGKVDLTYHEHPGGHNIDPRSFDELREFVTRTLSTG